jgi:hypothetical protein
LRQLLLPVGGFQVGTTLKHRIVWQKELGQLVDAAFGVAEEIIGI